MMDQENGLPDGWVLLPIKSLGKTVTGNTPPTKELDNYGGDIPFIKPSELVDQPVSAGRETISNKGAEKARIMPKGGVLVSCIGNLGKTAIAKRDVAFNQQINAILFNEYVIPEYGFYYFQTADFRKDLESLASATTISIVNKSKFDSIHVPVVSLEQQHRIVAEIEKQFSRLDEAVAGLKRIQANLKRYRASVLKAAVEGKLTAEWRKKHPDTEPAEQLLQRILKERRAHWEQAELEKMQAAGKLPKDELWKQKYKGPDEPDVSGLPVLPEGWIWGSFEQVAERVTVGFVGSMKHQYVDSGIPFLRSQNVRENRYEPQGLKYISQEFHQQIKKSSLLPDDLVVVRSGSVGVTCVLPETLGIANCSDLVIIKRPIGFIPKYGAYYMNSIVNTRVASKKVGVALTHFNTQSVAEMQIPLPPIQEQAQIVSEVERRLSIADEVEQQINTNLKRAERLRQSILKKAFSGRLVPQDPNDEPAGMLMEKIKQGQRAWP